MDHQTEIKKKANTGKIGFVLSLVMLTTLFLTIFFCLLGPISFIFFCVSLFCCIHGLIKKRNRKFAITGLFINFAIIVSLFFLFIEFTPPGSLPYPLNIYKFKRVCPNASFWLDFDKANLEDVKSGMSFLSPYAYIKFNKNSGQYTKESIIAFSEKNNWTYHLSIPTTTKTINILRAKYEELSIEESEFKSYIESMNSIPMSLHEGDEILVLETRNYLGYASFITMSEKGNEIIIYYRYPVLPDPASDFWLPKLFDELSEKNE